MKFRAILSLILLTGVIGLGVIGCKKDRTCKVLIVLQDSLEEPVVGSLVFLTCDPVENVQNGPCIIEEEQTTLTDGTARFSFANPGILKVFVDGDPEGYVELEAGEEVEKIIVRP
jgi:hypothetical protein